VGGSPAGTRDFQDLCYNGFAGSVPIVLPGIFLVLVIGLRSIFTPIRLIITLCSFIMAATFGSLMLTSQIQMIEMGFVLCLAVILDATIMRLILVPAIMVMMKKYNWWMPSLDFLRKPKGGSGEKKDA
jgi:uncharacterized membrane protein YdfJ with MMPL/SSD domain